MLNIFFKDECKVIMQGKLIAVAYTLRKCSTMLSCFAPACALVVTCTEKKLVDVAFFGKLSTLQTKHNCLIFSGRFSMASGLV